MIRDISGAYCPMGCGLTLHLMSGGMIQCLYRGCPDPGAVQKILGSPETDDVVEFTDGHFTVLHPLKERLGDLFACQVHDACSRLAGPPEGRTGRFRARIDGDGKLELTPLDEPEDGGV